MRTDIVRMYKDIHTWVGIVSGLALFIAFYAGAITMFETPLQRWASPPSALASPVALEAAPQLVQAVLATHPEAAKGYSIHVVTGPEAPARMTWEVGDRRRSHIPPQSFAASLDASGKAVVIPLSPSPVAQLIDVLHQQVGLPFEHKIAMPIMGAIALLYGVALISGVIVLLPSLVKDLFVVRLGKNLKRMWLDVHNVLGVFSLPFHLIMALTSVVFAFHDQFYDTQNLALYDGKIAGLFAQDRAPEPKPGPGAQLLAPVALLKRVESQAPGFNPTAIDYSITPKGVTVARVEGYDPRYGMRSPTSGFATVDPYTGDLLETNYLPGHQKGWLAVVTSFFALHFGSFGGQPVRWGYFILGLSGAFIFYSGNLLWVESRRRRMTRKAGARPQSRSTQILGALTVGVSLGCIAGISVTVAAAKWLPGQVEDLAAWHRGLYYAVFLAAVAWAQIRGAARSSVELLYGAALATALIPASSLWGSLSSSTAWSHADGTLLVDLVAGLGATAFLLLARLTQRRVLSGPPASVWAASSKPLASQSHAPSRVD